MRDDQRDALLMALSGGMGVVLSTNAILISALLEGKPPRDLISRNLKLVETVVNRLDKITERIETEAEEGK